MNLKVKLCRSFLALHLLRRRRKVVCNIGDGWKTMQGECSMIKSEVTEESLYRRTTMYFKQLVKEDLGCASYIVGCINKGVCAVVDPRLDMVDDILEMVAAKGMRVQAVIETHNHADHISGHGENARRTCATIYVHELAHAEYTHKDLKDGDELVLGVTKLRVMHTPGHRPEHIAIAVSDTSRSEDPWLVLTGDSLFVGDVARPDWWCLVKRALMPSTTVSLSVSCSLRMASRSIPRTWQVRCVDEA